MFEASWSQFKTAFNWDQESFSLPLHEKLTQQHFELDPSSKMRNKLAEDVLDSKMLFFMQVTTRSYAKSFAYINEMPWGYVNL